MMDDNGVFIYSQRQISDTLHAWLEIMRASKPGDRSPQDRAWAVTITMMEQMLAYFDVWASSEEKAE